MRGGGVLFPPKADSNQILAHRATSLWCNIKPNYLEKIRLKQFGSNSPLMETPRYVQDHIQLLNSRRIKEWQNYIKSAILRWQAQTLDELKCEMMGWGYSSSSTGFGSDFCCINSLRPILRESWEGNSYFLINTRMRTHYATPNW